MSLFKCKMCGGALEIAAGTTVIKCEYCGTQQTLPKLDDDKRTNMYDRANHFRRNNDFDKAMGIYENILNEDNTDAEAYWSIVLCRYGIEYVEDPTTRKHVPTVNRAQFTSIFDDEDYKSAIANADGYQREIYEAEATEINEIQKGILAISQKEEPFDIFICYKETDTHGRRTPDSVLATELYHELTREGFKVFFSRITLEDKLGVAYEPYIFAALHSAKVMVVLGTRPEHFNSVWVKNEWSRYLALIKNGARKTLIPAYRDMDPYDLPEEFSHLQAQDMSKLGFMQDLTRGIKKIVKADAPKATVKEAVVTTAAAPNISPLLKRAFMFLEDGDFETADEYCEKVLDQDPENAQAYLGKLMAELYVKRQADLADYAEPFDNNKYYQKAIRFAGTTLAADLKGYIDDIKDRNARKAEEARKSAEYLLALEDYRSDEINRVEKALKEFSSLAGYKDSEERVNLCQARINQIHIKEEKDRIERERKAEEKRIADEKARLEKQRQAEIDRLEAAIKAKRKKKITMIVTLIAIAIAACSIIYHGVIVPNGKYNDAFFLMNVGQYENAITAFEALNGYRDSDSKVLECKYSMAISLMNEGGYEEAIAAFEALDGYKDCAEKADSCFDKYKVEKLKSAKVGDCVLFGAYEQDNNTSNGKENVEWIVLEVKDGKVLVISKYALDCKQYNTTHSNVTWETCTLRKWLNNEFINFAFSKDEKAMIPTVTVSADKNPIGYTIAGNATRDKVFLLSITEANRCFSVLSTVQYLENEYEYQSYSSDDNSRKCNLTKYAVANGASDLCFWWLRTPGYTQSDATYVSYDGVVVNQGFSVHSEIVCIRPAMWIDISNI